MKKISLLLALFVTFSSISMDAKAQGNLQFNKVINNVYTAATTSSASITTTTVITVPTGKAWKLESLTSSYVNNASPTSLGSTGNLFNVYIDGGLLGIGTNFPGPVWLGAGAHTLVMYGTGSGSVGTTYTYTAVFSGVEFNITQ